MKRLATGFTEGLGCRKTEGASWERKQEEVGVVKRKYVTLNGRHLEYLIMKGVFP